MYTLTEQPFMKNSLDKFRQKITGAPRYSISSELDRKVQGALGWQKMSPTLELEAEESLLSFNWITPWLMKSFKQFAVVIAALVLMVGGFWFYTQNSYSYHLGKAKAALADLQSVLDGKPIAQNPFMNRAFAEDSDPSTAVNEALVVDLTETVVEETEQAIEIVEEESDPVVVEAALEEVVVLQDETVPVLAAAAEAVTSDEAVQAVADALETTTTDQAVVVQAQEFVAEAASAGETEVAIDIQTSSDVASVDESAEEEEDDDGKKLEDAKAEYQDAKTMIDELKASGATDEELAKLQAKLDKVVAAFEEGKIGRAHGLSTAIAAQSKHRVRKAEREESKKMKAEEEEAASDLQATEEESSEASVDESSDEPDDSDERDEGQKEKKEKSSKKAKSSDEQALEPESGDSDEGEVVASEVEEDDDESEDSVRPRIPEVKKEKSNEKGNDRKED